LFGRDSVKRAALLLVASACYSRLWHEPADLPIGPQHVPLDVEWQWPLLVYSGGSPEPMPVTDVKAACIPADACTVVVDVPRDPRFADPPRLSVIGARTGAAKLDITYVHPKLQTQVHATLDFVFEPDEHLHVLAVGDAPPTAPFIYDYRGTQMRCDAWGTELDCYARERDHFTCSGSACGIASSRRYQLQLDVDAGHIKTITLMDSEGREALQRTP
jgi:hypothetical protein